MDANLYEYSKELNSESELRSLASNLGLDDSKVTKYLEIGEHKIAPAAYMMLREWLHTARDINTACNKIVQAMKLFKQVSLVSIVN